MFTRIEYNLDVVLYGLKEQQKSDIFSGNIIDYVENEKLIQHVQGIIQGNHPLIDKYKNSFNDAVSI